MISLSKSKDKRNVTARKLISMRGILSKQNPKVWVTIDLEIVVIVQNWKYQNSSHSVKKDSNWYSFLIGPPTPQQIGLGEIKP